ncbi:MAG: hypothetical protein ACM36C_15550 [Acidobacteriota bacterium]
MALVFARKSSRTRRSARLAAQRSAAQGCLWDATVVGRSFAQSAMTFKSGDEALRERLKELELRRRRAQIKARRVLEDREVPAAAAPAALPFAS